MRSQQGESGGQPGQSGGRSGSPQEPAGPPDAPAAVPTFDLRDPVVMQERRALESLLQVPRLVPATEADGLGSQAFRVPAHQMIYDAVSAAGGIAVAVGLPGPAWVSRVVEYAPDAVAPLIHELAVAPLPADREEGLAAHAVSAVLKVAEGELLHRTGMLKSRLRREGTAPESRHTLAELLAAEAALKALRDRIHGIRSDG